MKERFDRRSGQESLERKRKDDFGFEPIAKLPEFAGVEMNSLESLYRYKKSKTT